LSLRNPYQLWQQQILDRKMDAQIARVEAYLSRFSIPKVESAPILFFNASTRIHRVSLNAAFCSLASWALRAKGYPVRHLVCRQGMLQCILGTQPQKPAAAPPCGKCIQVSRRLYPHDLLVPFDLDPIRIVDVGREFQNSKLEGLMDWTYQEIPLGKLVLPGLRWALRRHNLEDTDRTRLFYRQYLSSAVNMVESFEQVLRQIQPVAVVLFNGIFYPEAVLRYMADTQGIPVITHEVGLQPFSAFFSHREATFREVDITFEKGLTETEQAQLDAYLEGRFRGDFSMAGIQFWDSMQDLPGHIKEIFSQFSSMVPVFTNVVFDTSQIHANTLFQNMFVWLDGLIEVIDQHPEVLFVIRAHPDEDRPGKASDESVADWVDRTEVGRRSNVIFIGPGEELSSYNLIDQAKLVLVYNSSIGLEASILGKPVLCAGRARYTQVDAVFFPESEESYWVELEQMLMQDRILLPEEFRIHAQQFLYRELFRASLDLSAFLELDPTLPGMVLFREFDPEYLLHTPALTTITEGITKGKDFLLVGQ